MKKALVLLAAFSMVFTLPSVYAADKKGKVTLEEQELLRREELTDMEWDVTTSGKGGGADKLVFNGNQVSLKGFEKLGYGPTAYSLIAYEDSDRGTWETYQVSRDSKSSLSVRGDWQGKIMNGVIAQQTIEGKSLGSWTFSSQSKTSLKPAEASPDAETGGEVAEEAPAQGSSGVLVSKESSQE